MTASKASAYPCGGSCFHKVIPLQEGYPVQYALKTPGTPSRLASAVRWIGWSELFRSSLADPGR